MKIRAESWLNLADILVLWSLAVAQPIYSLLSKEPQFFVARGAGTSTLLLFIFVLSFLLPLVLFGVEILLTPGGRFARVVHSVIVAGLIALLIFPPVKRSLQLGGTRFLVMAFVLGLIVAALYIKLRQRAFSLAILLPLILIFPVVFLFFSPIRGVLSVSSPDSSDFPKIDADTPIVMVVFDEFPVVSLMKETHEIDAGRYPNFAAFARSATWFRNASTVGESTSHGLPAILDGLYPNPDARTPPNAEGHPHSLFTLLGGSYRFNVVENMTQVCPQNLKARLPRARATLLSWISDVSMVYLHTVLPTRFASRLPDISHSWKDYGKVTPLSDSDDPKYVFGEFLKRITPGDSTLHFVHLRLPHFPWSYLPNGRRYSRPEMAVRGVIGTNDIGEDPSRWTSDEWAVMQGYQRHLLQVGMADWMLGRLITRLTDLGLYQRSLIVVTADHGASFRTEDSRRVVTSSNYPDILAIPLFIKKPNQTEGRIDDRNIETIDILPTIADMLGIPLPWKVDGVSADKAGGSERVQKHLVADSGLMHVFEADLTAKYETLNRQVEWFGSGNWQSLFRLGLPSSLLDKPISSVPVRGSLNATYALDDEATFANVDPKADTIITRIAGDISRSASGSFVPLKLAVIVNNRIVAGTESFLEAGKEKFISIVSDSDFVRGPNRVEVFAVPNPPDGGLLALKKQSAPDYELGQRVTFGTAGTATRYLAGGWSFAEKEFRWTDGTRAEMLLPMPQPRTPVMLRAEACGYVVPGKVPVQHIKVSINEHVAGEWVVDHRDFREKTLLLQPGFFRDSMNILRFDIPDAAAPHRLGLAKDVRRLGLAVRSLSITTGTSPAAEKPAPAYRWGQGLDFGNQGNATPFLRSGWSAPERGINWNDGMRAELAFKIPPTKAAVSLRLFLKPYLSPGKVDRQRLRVLVNGQLIGEKRLTDPQFQDVVFEIPANALPATGNTILTLETPDSTSPAALGKGGDQRHLGVAMRSLRLVVRDVR